MRDSNHILLLEMAIEGGKIRLVLEPNELGIFSYRLYRNSSERYLFLDEDFLESQKKGDECYWRNTCPLVVDWAGALRLLDDSGWSWPIFTPRYIHHSVRHLVLIALKDRYSRYPEIKFEEWERYSGWEGGEDAFDEEKKK